MDGVDSVESLLIRTREAANDPRVNPIVAHADLLFIAGGDQSSYIKLWKGIALDDPPMKWIAIVRSNAFDVKNCS